MVQNLSAETKTSYPPSLTLKSALQPHYYGDLSPAPQVFTPLPLGSFTSRRISTVLANVSPLFNESPEHHTDSLDVPLPLFTLPISTTYLPIAPYRSPG